MQTCDLCGMAISGDPVTDVVDNEEKHFCCGGCAQAYRKAHEAGMSSDIQRKPSYQQMKPHKAELEESAYFSVTGMWCAGCASAAENVLKNQVGIKDANVSFAAERGRVIFDPDLVDIHATLEKLEKLGYQAQVLGSAGEQKAEKKQENTLLQLITSLAFGMQIMLLYLTQLYPLYNAGDYSSQNVRNLHYLVWALATPILLVGGASFLKGAWRALMARTATMDTLVAIGTISAYLYSGYIVLSGNGETYFDSIAMITTFIMLGRYLEAIGGAQARKDIRHLLNLQPDKAWKKDLDQWQQVKSASLLLGDTVLVKPGERIPVDGKVLEGQAAVNEAMLTGESMPVDKSPGDKVFAGTLDQDAPIELQVTEPIGESRLAQITKIVEETLAQKPPIQRLADKASAYFAFGILGVAVLTVVGWLLAGANLGQSLLVGVSVLVVACPCALGLATPLAITVTLGKTTQEGLLVRNLEALETAARVQRIVFDKTGTLTRGEMQVLEIHLVTKSALQKEELLQIAASAEQYSEHPIAAAILQANKKPLLPVQNFYMERGAGIQAEFDEPIHTAVRIGNLKYIGAEPHQELHTLAQACSKRGETVTWIGWENTLQGFLTFRDEPTPSAKSILLKLKEMDISPAMVSGDSIATTAAIAEELGLSEFEGECPPEEKAKKIKDWQANGEHVAMVGDGINDAPALAQADLSITVVGGTAVAGETSDVLLTHSDLNLIPWLIETSRFTHRVILQNLGWAFAYNLVSVPLASFGIISPVIAAITMATSSLLVVGNSLRLRKKREN